MSNLDLSIKIVCCPDKVLVVINRTTMIKKTALVIFIYCRYKQSKVRETKMDSGNKITHNEQGLLAVGELTNCPPGPEAKFITKSRSLELRPGRIPSAGYKAWICTADDCTSVCPQLHKTAC